MTFIDFFNECCKTGKIKDLPANLRYSETYKMMTPQTQHEHRVVRHHWDMWGTKFTLHRQFSILLCAAINDEI